LEVKERLKKRKRRAKLKRLQRKPEKQSVKALRKALEL
jgi:hypothetical protein